MADERHNALGESMRKHTRYAPLERICRTLPGVESPPPIQSIVELLDGTEQTVMGRMGGKSSTHSIAAIAEVILSGDVKIQGGTISGDIAGKCFDATCDTQRQVDLLTAYQRRFDLIHR